MSIELDKLSRFVSLSAYLAYRMTIRIAMCPIYSGNSLYFATRYPLLTGTRLVPQTRFNSNRHRRHSDRDHIGTATTTKRPTNTAAAPLLVLI